MRGRSHFSTHKSIGNNILDGIGDLAAQDPARYSIAVNYSSGTGAGLNHYQPGSNQQPYSKINGFAGLVKDGHHAAFMKFCVGDICPWNGERAAAIWAAYRDMMEAQQAEHPNTVLVWWTIPLVTEARDRSGGNAEKAVFNQNLRDYCAVNGCVVFDIADIEAYDPNGNPVTDRGGNEACWSGYVTDGAPASGVGDVVDDGARGGMEWAMRGRVMRQASKRAVGFVGGAVFVMACILILMATSGGFILETLAADGALTPWVYLPFISGQGLSTPTSWYGVVRAPVDDWSTIRENLGGSVVDLIVYPYTPLSDIIASLDSAEALQYQVVFHLYDGNTNTNKPWYLDVSEQWVFPQSAIDVLQAVSDHPALFAIYALHEPLDEGEAYVSVEAQRELYWLLKQYTGGLPVYTDIGGLGVWEDRGIELTDGICDYCRTGPSHFRSDWTSERCLAETLRRIDADLDTQQRLMPNSQTVFAINTYSFSGYHYPIRLPTPYELGVVKDYLCDLDQPMLYHPWHYSRYDVTLEDAPELWPTIAEGCTG